MGCAFYCPRTYNPSPYGDKLQARRQLRLVYEQYGMLLHLWLRHRTPLPMDVISKIFLFVVPALLVVRPAWVVAQHPVAFCFGEPEAVTPAVTMGPAGIIHDAHGCWCTSIAVYKEDAMLLKYRGEPNMLRTRRRVMGAFS